MLRKDYPFLSSFVITKNGKILPFGGILWKKNRLDFEETFFPGSAIFRIEQVFFPLLLLFFSFFPEKIGEKSVWVIIGEEKRLWLRVASWSLSTENWFGTLKFCVKVNIEVSGKERSRIYGFFEWTVNLCEAWEEARFFEDFQWLAGILFECSRFCSTFFVIKSTYEIAYLR